MQADSAMRITRAQGEEMEELRARVRRAAEDRAAIDVEAGKLWARLDQKLAGKLYVAGQHFTMGDIPVGCFVHRWYALPIERPDLKNVKAWYERLKTRPAYVKHVMPPLT